jgi:hypothetical protein
MKEHVMETTHRLERDLSPVFPAVALAALVALAAPAPARAQIALDVCGCAGLPALPFDSGDPATHPPGTPPIDTSTNPDTLTLVMPDDGVFLFQSMIVRRNPATNESMRILFQQNAANTPVAFRVQGDVTIESGSSINVGASSGTNGTTGLGGQGGRGGPGGYVGGDGANPAVNLALNGGVGVGAGGGRGGLSTFARNAEGGRFPGGTDPVPLLGGSGGGGGGTDRTAAGNSAGGGGGGGGAVQIAANGTITVGGSILANGGNGGSIVGFASGGAGGSGGAIRLLANTIAGTGSLSAVGGNVTGLCCGLEASNGSPGRIWLEAISIPFRGDGANPVAIRVPAPGPLANPISPAVRITALGGAPPQQPLTGFRGGVDLVVPAPGVIDVDLETSDVPSGTDVEVTVKPRVGGDPVSQRVTLASCASQLCTASIPFDLAAGAYVVEARATFEIP